MRYWLKYFFALSVSIMAAKGYCQLKVDWLEGDWTLANERHEYVKLVPFVLHQDANFKMGLNDCHYIKWTIKKDSILTAEEFECSEPGIIYQSTAKQTIKITKDKGKQLLVIYKNGKVSDRFEVIEFNEQSVDRYPYDIKSLTLKRITIKSTYKNNQIK